MTPNIIQQSDNIAASDLMTAFERQGLALDQQAWRAMVQSFASYRLQIMEEAAAIVDDFGETWGLSYHSMTNEIARAIRTNHRANEGGGDDIAP